MCVCVCVCVCVYAWCGCVGRAGGQRCTESRERRFRAFCQIRHQCSNQKQFGSVAGQSTSLKDQEPGRPLSGTQCFNSPIPSLKPPKTAPLNTSRPPVTPPRGTIVAPPPPSDTPPDPPPPCAEVIRFTSLLSPPPPPALIAALSYEPLSLSKDCNEIMALPPPPFARQGASTCCGARCLPQRPDQSQRFCCDWADCRRLASGDETQVATQPVTSKRLDDKVLTAPCKIWRVSDTFALHRFWARLHFGHKGRGVDGSTRHRALSMLRLRPHSRGLPRMAAGRISKPMG